MEGDPGALGHHAGQGGRPDPSGWLTPWPGSAITSRLPQLGPHSHPSHDPSRGSRRRQTHVGCSTPTLANVARNRSTTSIRGGDRTAAPMPSESWRIPSPPPGPWSGSPGSARPVPAGSVSIATHCPAVGRVSDGKCRRGRWDSGMGERPTCGRIRAPLGEAQRHLTSGARSDRGGAA
jgi:hypothetical protein